MSKAQRIVILTGTLLMLSAGLLPNHIWHTAYGTPHSAGRHFILGKLSYEWGGRAGEIDTERLGVERGTIILVTLGLVLALHKRRAS